MELIVQRPIREVILDALIQALSLPSQTREELLRLMEIQLLEALLVAITLALLIKAAARSGQLQMA